MTEFLTAIVAFPTVIFTVLLLIVVFYWLMVIVGAIGVDILHIGEAAGGKLEGMVGGAIEGKVQGLADGAIEGKLEGLADGAAEAAAGKLEGAAGKIAGAAGGGGFLAMLGFGKIPATVVLSSIALWSWAACLLVAQLLGRTGLPAPVVGGVAAISAVFVAGLLTGGLVRALGRVIVHHEPVRRRDLVGKLCTITTGRVDANFGQAIVDEGAHDFTIDVRCEPPNTLVRRSRAVVIAYDAEHNVYTVEAYEQGLATSDKPV
jgi:hypothetical protein